MYCMYGIKFTVKNTVFDNNIRIFESPTSCTALLEENCQFYIVTNSDLANLFSHD